MPVQTTYPGVYIEEIPSAVRTITGVATSIAAFIGWVPQGPTDAAGRVLSWEDYVRIYGGLHPLSAVSYAVFHFFNNGGQDAYIVPVLPATPATGDNPDAPKAAKVTLSEKLIVTAKVGGTAGNAYTVSILAPTPPATNPGGEADPLAEGEDGGATPPATGRFGRAAVEAEAEAAAPKTFHLQIKRQSDKSVLENFVNLSMDPNDPNFVENIVNAGSALVNVKVVVPEGAPPPTEPPPAQADQPLVGGSNGNVGANSLASAIVPAGATGGYHLLEHVDLFNLLCAPGLTDLPALSVLQGFCRDRRALLIVDAAPNATRESLNNGPDPTLTGSDSINSAFYFPWVLAPDPLDNNRIKPFPPSGFVAGVYASTDVSRGVWKAPAGVEASLTGVAGVAVPLTDRENGVLNPQAINCIRNLPVYGTVVWGARTLAGNDQRGSEWKYVPVRRTALFIEETLYRNLKWVVFEPNDEPLWASIRLNVGSFMHNLFRQGAFQGQTPREAYLVKCDKDTTTQDDINRGVVNILVGFAPLKPAEFVVVQIQQLAGQLVV